MISIPSEISVRFNSALAKHRITKEHQNHYRKWLRYFLDFCLKYNFQSIQPESLQNFLRKLEEKNQTREQQKQASHAVSLYFAIAPAGTAPDIVTMRDGRKGIEISTEKEKYSGESESQKWKSAFDSLSAEIKLRHYSPKTLKSYRS